MVILVTFSVLLVAELAVKIVSVHISIQSSASITTSNPNSGLLLMERVLICLLVSHISGYPNYPIRSAGVSC